MPNLLSDLPVWIASEIRWNARLDFLEEFWDSQEQFAEAMNCQGLADRVNPMLFSAFNAKTPHEAMMFLRDAKKAVEEFSSELLPDEFIQRARDEWEAQEVEHG